MAWAAQVNPGPSAPVEEATVPVQVAVPPPEIPGATTMPEPPPTESVGPPVRPPSRALGRPFSRGRLVHGVPFPPTGLDHFTWDPVLKQSPNRVWRRYATDRTVNRVLVALAAF